MKTFKEYLEYYANQLYPYDDPDFNPMDASGGNFDDCFSAGEDAGYICMAREILKKYVKLD